MNRPNTSYGIRPPAREDIVRVLGSVADAYRITGGDLPTLCFYMANPERAQGAPTPPPGTDAFARAMRDEVELEAAAAAWDAQPADKRRTVQAVMSAIGRGRIYTRRLLVRAKRIPASVGQATEGSEVVGQ